MKAGMSGDFALSVQSVSRLKHSARNAPREGLKESAKQFEALFLQQMLKQMRDAMPQSDLLRSNQSDMYQSLMDKQWAQTLAQRGIGLADMLTRQLQGKTPDAADDTAALGNMPTAEPRPLRASDPIGAHTPDSGKSARVDSAPQPVHTPLIAAQDKPAPLFGVASAPETSAAERVRRAVLPEHVTDFLDRMAPAAGVASRETGIPQRLILAQAALETGWGRHEIKRDDGTPSFNVFNIKATGWQGESARVSTTEFDGGQAYRTRAAFRAYDSYEQAFSDYGRLLTESPRYKPVADAPTAEAAAQALQDCGYATDPAYADKLVSIMSRLPAFEPQARGPSPLVQIRDGAGLVDKTRGADAPDGDNGGIDIGYSRLRVAEAETEDEITRLF